MRGHIVLANFTGPVGEVYAGYGLTQLTTVRMGTLRLRHTPLVRGRQPGRGALRPEAVLHRDRGRR